MAGFVPAMPAFDNKSFVPDDEKNVIVDDRDNTLTHRRLSVTSRLSRLSYVSAINDDDEDAARQYYNETAPEQGFAQAAADGLKRIPSYRRKSQVSLSPAIDLPTIRRGSRASNLSQASFVTAKNDVGDNKSDIANYYYDELPPEQHGFAQAATDGLKPPRDAPSLLRKHRRPSRVSFADVPTVIPTSLSPTESQESRLTTSTAPADAEEHLSKRKKFFLLFLLCVTNLCLAMCYALIAPFFPGEMLRKGGTATLSGVVMSGYDFARTFMSPVFGLYIYTIGPRFMLITGPLSAAWCTVLFGLVDKLPPGIVMFTITACVLRMISGVGNNAYVVVSIAIRPVLFGNFMSFAFGILQASYTTGIIVGPAAGSVLYSLGGFGLPFYVMGGITLTLTVIQMFAVPDLSKFDTASTQQKLQRDANAASARRPSTTESHAVDRHTAVTYRQPGFFAFCRDPKLLLTFVMYASFGFSLTFYSANLALHIRPLLGDNPDSKAGYIILIAGVTEVLVAPFAGLSLDYGVPAKLACVAGYAFNFVGLALIGPSPLLMFLTTKLWLVILGSAIFGCGIGCALSAPYKLATQYVLQAGFPANQQTFGLLAGCFGSAMGVGAFVGPLIGGALTDLVGYPWASTVACGYLLGLILLIIVTSIWTRLRSVFGIKTVRRKTAVLS